MNIAFATTHDPTSPRAWSGSPYFMQEALRGAGHTVIPIGPLEERWSWALKGLQLGYRMIGKRHLRQREPVITEGYARAIERALQRVDADILFSPGTRAIAQLDVDIPVVFWTDATFAGMIGYYDEFSRLSQRSLRNGHRHEQEALRRAALAIYSSEWAAQSALSAYDIEPDRVATVPLGANVEVVPDRDLASMRDVIEAREDQPLRLLWIGVDWKRKGGDVAVRVVERLNEDHGPAELVVVGCQPEIPRPLPDYIRPQGFIDKTHDDGRKAFIALLKNAHYLIHPARAECLGIVIREAQAYGVPVLASNTGGIPSVVTPGVNGHLIPFASSSEHTPSEHTPSEHTPPDRPDLLSATVDDYVSAVVDTRRSGAYRRLAESTFRDYASSGTWLHAAQQVTEKIEQRLASSSSAFADPTG